MKETQFLKKINLYLGSKYRLCNKMLAEAFQIMWANLLTNLYVGVVPK